MAKAGWSRFLRETKIYHGLNFCPVKKSGPHVYAGGSYVVVRVNIVAGLFSALFFFCPPVRHIALAFAEEVVAILFALTQMDRLRDIYRYAVILKDSKPAIQAVHNLEPPKTYIKFIQRHMHSLLNLTKF